MGNTEIREILRHLTGDEEGATAVEYAIVASLIAGVISLAVSQLGVTVSKLFVTNGW